MSFKTTYFLFGALVVILAVFGVALWKYDEGDGGRDTGYVLAAAHDPARPIKTEDITEVVIDRKVPREETITFVKDPETSRWQISTPRKLRADTFAVNDLIRQVFDARRDEKADKPTTLKAWDLDPPNETITLKGRDREIALHVGGTSPGSGSSQVVYVCPADDAKVSAAAVRKNQIDSVLKPLVEFRDRSLLTSSPSDIQALTVAEGKKETVSLKKDADSRWVFVKPEGYGLADYEGDVTAFDKTKPISGLKNVLDDLANLKVEYKDEKDNDFVADDVSPTDLAKYELDPAKNNVLRIEIERVESVKAGEGGKDDKKTAKVVLLVGGVAKKDAEGKPEKYYACLEGERNVVRIPAKGVEPVRKLLDDPNSLRDKTLVQLGGLAKPDAIVIKNDYGTLEFFREDSLALKPWKLYRGGDKGEDVDASMVDGLITLLTQKGQVKGYVDDPAKRGALELDKPVATVSLWLDGIAKEEKKDDKKDEKKDGEKKDAKKDDKKDEKKDEKKEEKKPARPKLKDPDKPTVKLLFGRKEAGLVAVERLVGGEKTTSIVKVPELLLDRVREGPLAYFDKSLPQFNPGEFVASQHVSKLVLTRGGTTTELTREGGKEDAPWKFAAPKDMAGRTADSAAVTGVLNALNRLQAQKLVAEKASAADLQKDYGLGTPSLKAVVTVTKDGKDTEFVYEFGKQLDNAVYGKQGQRDTIFLVDKNALASLETAELQDKTVFNFDVAKVKQLKMSGWQNVVGSLFTIDLERKDASEWTVKAPPGFNIDATKVRRFLDDLSHLKAEKFVAHNAKPTPDQELEVAKGALQIDITLEGQMEPLQLTVGKLDGDKGYFATTNKLPGDILLLRKEIFEAPKSKPAHFNP
jgi:hypothetical protein